MDETTSNPWRQKVSKSKHIWVHTNPRFVTRWIFESDKSELDSNVNLAMSTQMVYSDQFPFSQAQWLSAWFQRLGALPGTFLFQLARALQRFLTRGASVKPCWQVPRQIVPVSWPFVQ